MFRRIRTAVTLLLILLLALPLGALAEQAAQEDWEIDTSPITLTFYSNSPENPDGEFTNYWGKNPVTAKITEVTGVTPECIYAPDSSGQKLNLLIATGDLPDIIMDATPEQEKELIEEGLVWDLSELAATAAPNFANMVPENVALNIRLQTDTPGLYKFVYAWARPEIVEKYGLARNAAGPTVVKEIYEELGSPEIKTGEDYYQFLKKAVEKYPDMIVHSSRYGTNSTGKYATPRLLSTLMQLGGVNTFYRDESGKVRYFYDDPAFLEVIQYANKLFSEKLVFQDEFIADTTVKRANLTAGRVMGELSQDYDNLVLYSEQLAAGEGGKYGFTQFIMLEPFSITDRAPSYKAQTYAGETGGFMISKTSENAARALRFMEYVMYDDECQKMIMFGVEGVHHDMVDGEPVLRQEYRDAYKADFLKTRAETGIHYLGLFRNSEWQSRMYAQVFGNPQYVLDALELTNKYAVDLDDYDEIDVFPQNSEELKIFANIKDYYSGEIVKILNGAPEDVEAGYSAMLENLKTLGLEKLNDYVNASYLARQEKMVEYSK